MGVYDIHNKSLNVLIGIHLVSWYLISLIVVGESAHDTPATTVPVRKPIDTTVGFWVVVVYQLGSTYVKRVSVALFATFQK